MQARSSNKIAAISGINEKKITYSSKTQILKLKKERIGIRLPEGGDGREVGGGGHDGESDGGESELEEAQGEAGGSAGHALDVLHPSTRHRILLRRRHRICHRRRHRIHWVNWRVARAHFFFFKEFLRRLSLEKKSEIVRRNNFSSNPFFTPLTSCSLLLFSTLKSQLLPLPSKQKRTFYSFFSFSYFNYY